LACRGASPRVAFQAFPKNYRPTELVIGTAWRLTADEKAQTLAGVLSVFQLGVSTKRVAARHDVNRTNAVPLTMRPMRPMRIIGQTVAVVAVDMRRAPRWR
jgi:hypothetical protein